MEKIFNNVQKIQLTYGGGMGGSSVELYATSIDKRNPNLWIVQSVWGSTGPLEINPRYVVYCQPGYDIYERPSSKRYYAVNSMDEFDPDAWYPGHSSEETVRLITFPH